MDNQNLSTYNIKRVKLIEMSRKLKNIIINLWIIMFVNFVDESCGSANFLFRQKTIPSVPTSTLLTKEMRTDSPWWLSGQREKQQLCHYARMEANLPYMDYNITNNWHETKSDKLTNVILCPTLPTMFLLKRDWIEIVQITFLESGIDDIVFNTEIIEEAEIVFRGESSNLSNDFRENDLLGLDTDSRVALCKIAREYAAIPKTDSDVHGAELYSFKYDGEKEVHDIALRCPMLPEMYLRLADPLKKIIKITSVQNPYERFVYTTEFFDYIFDAHDVREAQEEIAAHWFATLTPDDRWKLCYAVQKRIPHFLKLKTNPQHYIKPPRIKTFIRRYPTHRISDETNDVAIKCSGLPVVYVRIIQQSENNEIKVIQIAIDVDYFALPRLRTLSDDYDEEQDNYDG